MVKGVIGCILGAFLQCTWCMKTLSILHLYAYHILIEVVAVFHIKLEGLLEKLCNLDTVLLFNTIFLSLGSKYP